MKKTLVALAVAAMAATSANAATVYEQDGTKVELSGSLRVFLGRVGDDNRGDLKNDGSRIILKASHDLGNGLSAFAGYQLRFEDKVNNNSAQAGSDSNFGSPTTRQLYAGFAHKDIGALSFGRHTTNADDVLQDRAYYNSAMLSPLTTRSDKSIKFKSAEWNGFSFGLDYLFGDSVKVDQESDYKNGYAATLFYNYDISEGQKLDFAALYSQDNYDAAGTSDTVQKNRLWVLHAGYQFGAFDISGNYGQYKNKFDSNYGTTEKGRYSLVDAGYRFIEPSRLYAQWERLDAKADGSDQRDVTNVYIAGVDYKFHKNVIAYVEYAHVRLKDATANAEPVTKKDNVYGVGLRVYF